MVMGGVLVRPQRVRRARAADPSTAFLSSLFDLAGRLATDAEGGGRIAEITQAAGEEALRTLLVSRTAAFEAAAPRLADWALRVLRALTGVGPEMRVGSPADGLDIARQIIATLAATSQNATAPRLRPYIAELLDIVQTELGLGLPALEQVLWDVVETVIDRLEAEPTEADRARRETRLDTIRMLRRIRTLVRGRFPLPSLDADRIADALARFLRRIDIAALGRQAECVSDGVGTIAGTTRAIEDLVDLGSFSEFRNLGAAAAAASSSEQYLWYASWLFGEDVVINAACTEIRRGDTVIRSGTGLTVADVPEFQSSSPQHYTFLAVDLQAMETLAYVMAVSADALNMLLHLLSLEEGDYASNGFNATWNAFIGVGKVVAGRPIMSSGLEDWLMPLVFSFMASLEGIHTRASVGNFFTMWLALGVPDLGETVILRQVSLAVRDGFLSFFTLLNYEGPFWSDADPDPRPLNRKHVDGVATPIGALINKILYGIFPRDEYAQPFSTSVDHSLKFWLFWDLFLGSLFAVLGRVAGCLVAMGVSRTFDPGAWFEKIWKDILLGVVLFLPQLYMEREGDTDEGKFNGAGAAYAGYPPHDAAPYTLPYNQGVSCYVDQANQGLFSHHQLNLNQTYSYDFALDEDAIILAARSGTVVDYFDWVPDDTNPSTAEITAAANEATASGFLDPAQTQRESWNFILIRHDRDDAGALVAPDATHDKGAGGAVTRTYAVYGHGRKDSVRNAFGDRGIAPASIIGSVVQRGQQIMRSGDTGISFHNHLHIAVIPGPDPTPLPRVVRAATLPRESIPFVFRDVTHFIGRDGVCKVMNSYTSSTEPVT